jgi:hypothetical protein
MLWSYVNTVANPAKSLESHPCTPRTLNSHRITSLRKNRGRGYIPAIPQNDLGPSSGLLETQLFNDLLLCDWIHHPSHWMQESQSASIIAPTFVCYRNSLVDTIHRLPYSAPANESASPSPPSSSRHSAAFDEVCIADSLTQDSHHPLAQRPSGFFVFKPGNFAEGWRPKKRQNEKKSQDERTRCNSISPNPTA